MELCGQCNKEFENEKGYLDHTCEVSGFTPRDPENLGERFVEVSKAALERGNKRAELEAEGKTPEEAVKETRDIGTVVK